MRPAANIDWYEAAAFVNWLNTSSGYQAAYNLTFSGNWSMALWNSADAWTLGGTNLYRHNDAVYFLPSENEWYKAAYYNPAGTNYFLYPTGSDTAPTGVASGTNAGTAVYRQPTAQGPAPVDNAGGFSPYGTMGQGGNVWEWNETASDGDNNSVTELRSMRGGPWDGPMDYLQSADRGSLSPSNDGSYFGVGFRVASLTLSGNYWAPGVGGGGSGTWGSGSDVWAAVPASQGSGSQGATGPLIFGNTAGTVTVSGTVSAVAGMQFSTDGYTVLSNTITLAGANIAANTITTDAFVGATINSVLAGSAGMTKAGTGTLTLGGISTYTGPTSVEAGKLVVSGSIAGSTVTVNNGGTLAGSGTVGGIVLNLGSTLSPGNSPGTLAVAGNSVWNPGANYNWQLYDTALGAGTGWDLVNATGTLDLSALTVGSEFNINLWSLSAIAPDANGNALNFNPNQSYTWTILTAAGGISGFTGSSQFVINTGVFNGTGGFANALDGGSFSLAQSLDGKDLNLVFTAAGGAPIPEPGTWAAAALLVGGAAFMRWRKRTKVS
jgi:autotransporter-associated beta strand protein